MLKIRDKLKLFRASKRDPEIVNSFINNLKIAIITRHHSANVEEVEHEVIKYVAFLDFNDREQMSLSMEEHAEKIMKQHNFTPASVADEVEEDAEEE